MMPGAWCTTVQRSAVTTPSVKIKLRNLQFVTLAIDSREISFIAGEITAKMFILVDASERP